MATKVTRRSVGQWISKLVRSNDSEPVSLVCCYFKKS